MHDFIFERISNKNLKHIQSLYSTVYSRKISVEYLHGKYNTELFGVACLGYLALTRDKKPVAFYGLVPCHFKINEQKFLAAQAVDAMTHINYRNNKLFLQLAKQAHDTAREEGVQFIFGFPNQNSYTGLVKLGWNFTTRPIQIFILSGSRFPIAKFILRVPILKALYQLIEKRNFENTDEFVAWSSRNGVIRDKLFIAHKNQYTNTFIKKWGKTLAWLKNDGILKVGLLHIDPSLSATSAMAHLKETAKILGCKTILLMASSNTQLYKTLTTITTSRDGLPIGFYNLTNRYIDFEQAEFEYCDIDIF
jgi:hypothetical protein